jgi:hypothetical protein
MLWLELIFSLFDPVELVDVDVTEDLFLPTGPCYFHGFCSLRLTHAEICAQVAL